MSRILRHSRFATLIAVSLMASCSITAAGTATADNAEGTSAPREPVKYRVKEKSLIGNDLHEAGATVSYAGLPSENLEPLCDIGRARFSEYLESNSKRVQTMIASTASESQVGDPAKFMAAFAEEMAKQRTEHQEQMAKMLELQHNASLQLAEAAKNMATLAAAITGTPAAAEPADPAPETAATGNGDNGAALAKRTRG